MNSADEVPSASVDIERNLALKSGSCAMRRHSASSLATIAGGVPAGANNPSQSATFMLTPLCCMVGGGSAIAYVTWLLTTLITESFPLLNGMACPGVPVLSLNSSDVSVKAADVL